MLTVPATIKTLFQTDSVQKNFRVHFPNGENSDLTNSDIVAESMSFTESICSKEVFQFGLSERSQIQFECVGVQNIYGYTIQCSIEIDTSSLTAAQITAIQSDPGDGTLVLEADSDIGYGYYRVPLGTFIVQDCPRSQGAMKHRKVTAYSVAGSNAELSAYTKKKFAAETDDATIQQNALLLMAEAGQDISGLTVTETTLDINDFTLADGTVSRGFYDSSDTLNTKYSLKGKIYRYELTDQTQIQGADSLIRFTSTDSGATFWNGVRTYLETNLNNYAKKYIDDVLDYFTKVQVKYTPYDSFGKNNNIYLDPADTGYFYPYYGTTQKPEISYVNLVSQLQLIVTVGATTTVEYTFGSSGTFLSNEALKIYTLSNTRDQLMNIPLNGTGYEKLAAPIGGSDTYYNYVESLNATDLYDGMLEIMASFGRIARTGGIGVFTLSTASPVAISPSQYSELWWDEYNVETIGTVNYKYHDADVNQDCAGVYTTSSGGGSVYEMQNNFVLTSLNVTASDAGVDQVSDYVNSILGYYFDSESQSAAFTPTQLDMIGLPYLEAGDYLAVDNADGGTVYTYILTRTLSGIQTLTDSIESKGGEVLGNG